MLAEDVAEDLEVLKVLILGGSVELPAAHWNSKKDAVLCLRKTLLSILRMSRYCASR